MSIATRQADVPRKRSPTRRLLLVAAVLVAILATFFLRPQPGPPIRIGVLHSLTGTMASSEAPLVDAVRLAVEEINAAGGLLGRQVELQVVDGRSDWTTFANEAERLISEEKVSALFACWTSACRKAVKPVVEKHLHLMFYPVQYEGLEQSAHIVYTGSAPNQQIIPGTRWAFDHLGKRAYLIGSDYIFPRTAHRYIRDLAAVSGGTILAEHLLPLGAPPRSAQIDEIRRLQPDVIFNTLNGDSNLHFFRALREAGLGNIPVLSFSLAEDGLTAMGPDAFHPSHYAAWSYFQSLPSASNRRFVAAFKARFGADRVTSDPVEAAYVGVLLWAQAVREAGTEHPEHVNRSIVRQSVAGPSGVAAIDGATRHLWKTFRIGRALANGQFAEVASSEVTVRPTPFPGYRGFADWQRIAAALEAKSDADHRGRP